MPSSSTSCKPPKKHLVDNLMAKPCADPPAKQKGLTLWFTGFSASGKSTIAAAVEETLLRRNVRAYRLDGDNVRFGLNQDLGFDERDRKENIRRIAEVALLFADACNVALTSFISPYKADRMQARALHASKGIPFIEIFLDITIEEAERRDPKGLYARARTGQVENFTGISAPYEPPEDPEITIKSNDISVPDATKVILQYLENKALICPD